MPSIKNNIRFNFVHLPASNLVAEVEPRYHFLTELPCKSTKLYQQ